MDKEQFEAWQGKEESVYITEDELFDLLPDRLEDGNKGSYGKVLLAAGSEGMSGAACLSALSAYRSGAGLVRALVNEKNRAILQAFLPEAVVSCYGQDSDFKILAAEHLPWADYLVAGPGLGLGSISVSLLRALLECIVGLFDEGKLKPSFTMLIDADGLNIISRESSMMGLFDQVSVRIPLIITPHPMEMSRISGLSIQDVLSNPMGCALDFSRKHHVITVLKGARTWVVDVDGKKSFQNRKPSPALSKAGSGDVLCGCIAGIHEVLRASRPTENPAFSAACLGVLIHAEAGRLAATVSGIHGVLARETADRIGLAMDGVLKRRKEQVFSVAGKEAYDRSWVIVDLDKIRRNALAAKRNLPQGTGFCAVVKTDAYGHGAIPVASAIDDLTDMYAVATVEEGVQLRTYGINKPVLCLGPVSPASLGRLLENKILPPVFTLSQAEEISRVAKEAGMGCADIVLVLDTGMGRIGISSESDDAVNLALRISSVPGIRIQGLFSHFARADEKDKEFTKLQMHRFQKFVSRLSEKGLSIPVCHIANSAGIIEGIGTGYQMARDGISLYGIYPSGEVTKDRLPLEAALSWRARISYVKTVPSGTPISYGGTFVTEKEMEVATLPVGYGDGFSRRLSNRGEVLVKGARCRILGRICMDQMMIDVSGIGAREGDVATLLGRDGEEEIDLYEWESLGLFSYEALCNIGKRVPRVYIREGKPVAVCKEIKG